MPTYTYKCTNKECPNANGFDIQLHIKDAPLKKCPICGAEVNTVFKGINVNLNFKGSYNSNRNK